MAKNKDIKKHQYSIDRSQKEKSNNHRAFILWITGLSGSGKSSLADGLLRKFHEFGYQTFLLDGDNIRHGLNSNLAFTPEDIRESNRRVSEVAKVALEQGNIVVIAMISPFRNSRALARNLVPPGDFIEIYCKSDLSTLKERDHKGLYERAKRGQIKNFIGFDIQYEKPINPEITLRTDRFDINLCLQHVMDYLHEKKYLNVEVDD